MATRKQAKYYSHGFSVRGRVAAQRDVTVAEDVTFGHLLPAGTGYPVPASSRVL